MCVIHPFINSLVLAVLLNVAASIHASENAASASSAVETYPVFNVRLGTQTFAPTYQFTSDTKLLETAARIREMGSGIIKFVMNKKWSGDSYGLPADPKIQSLVDLARNEPSYRAVLDMPFHYYLIWAYPFKESNWHDGLSEEEAQREYRQVYDFAEYLLRAYSGSRKTFLFGHWEGDWWLLGHTDAKRDPTGAAVQGMIDWLNIRQKAVEDARSAVPHSDVWVGHYTEVNLVKKAMEGGRTVTNDVLPHVTLDAVSYSSYDTIFDPGDAFVKALDYIRSKAHTTGHFYRDVFVGEYGFPLDQGERTPREQADQARNVFLRAVEWGCPFVLYWQMYDNEAKPGGVDARGFWLIDNQNAKQPVYDEHRLFLGKAHAFKNLHRFWLDRNPTEEEYSAWAGGYASFQTSECLRQIVNSVEYAGRVSDASFSLFLAESLLGKEAASSPERLALLKEIQGGPTRMDAILALLDRDRFAKSVSKEAYVEHLTRKTLRTEDPPEVEVIRQDLASKLREGATRSQLWLEALDRPAFFEAELGLLSDDRKGSPEVADKFFFRAP